MKAINPPARFSRMEISGVAVYLFAEESSPLFHRWRRRLERLRERMTFFPTPGVFRDWRVKTERVKRGRSEWSRERSVSLGQRTRLRDLVCYLVDRRKANDSQLPSICIVHDFEGTFEGEDLHAILDFLGSYDILVYDGETWEEVQVNDSWPPVLSTGKQLALLRAAIARKLRGTTVGRKPMGQTEAERQALDLIRRVLRKPRRPTTRSKKIRTYRVPYAQVAKQLNSAGISTKSGKPWTGSSVASIVYRYFPHLAGNRMRKRKRRSPPSFVPLSSESVEGLDSAGAIEDVSQNRK